MKTEGSDRKEIEQVSKVSTTNPGQNESGGEAGGMRPAFILLNMKKILLNTSAIAAVFFAASVTARAEGGGAEGGTNLNRETMELVEFERLGKVVRIDPKEFEGLYKEIEPRLEALDSRVPGLRDLLESAMNEKPWFMTTKEFAPRNAKELKPISQDKYGVFFSIDSVKKMNRQQRVQAFFHELVRGFVMKSDRLQPAEYDEVVEFLTPRLFDGSDRPEKQILEDIRPVSSVPFHGREAIARLIEQSKALERYERICERELKGRKKPALSKEEEDSLFNELWDIHPRWGVTLNDSAMNFDYRKNAMRKVANLGLVYEDEWVTASSGHFPFGSTVLVRSPVLKRERSIQNALEVCANSDEVVAFMRRVVLPQSERKLPRVNSIEDAIRALDGANRGPSSQGVPTYISNAITKGAMDAPEVGIIPSSRSGTSGAALR